MKNFALVQRACTLAAVVCITVLNASVVLHSQDKKEELVTHLTQHREKRVYLGGKITSC
jgi:hypothetical protein